MRIILNLTNVKVNTAPTASVIQLTSSQTLELHTLNLGEVEKYASISLPPLSSLPSLVNPFLLSASLSTHTKPGLLLPN